LPPAGYRHHGQQNHHEEYTDKEEALLFISFLNVCLFTGFKRFFSGD